MDKWTNQWPHETGVWLFYGWMTPKIEGKLPPSIRAVTVRRGKLMGLEHHTIEGPLYKSFARGVWKQVDIRNCPDEGMLSMMLES